MAKKAKVVTFTIPEFKLQNVRIPQLIMPVLIIVAFVWLGILTVRVFNLESSGTQNQPAPTVGAQASTAPSGPVNVSVGHFPVLGNANAKVTIIEFADFRCPFCEQFFTNTESQIIKDYVDTGKAKFAFRQYAFLGPASIVAADAAECANDQGKFWAFHDYLYKNQPPETDTSMYTTDTLTQDAVSLGMDGTKFSSCLSGKTDDSKQAQDLADGQKAGVTGTPTFFVNGVQLVGAQPYSAFQTAIDQALKSAK
jgi:protein-disulfide isomerase